MPVPRAPPSPVLPILVLGILGTMLMASTYWRLSRIDGSMPNTAQSSSKTLLGAAMQIGLLAILVQAFGIARRQDARSPLLSLLDSLLHNASFPLFITIVVVLLLLFGLTIGAQKPWQIMRTPSYGRCYVYRKRWYCN